MKQTNSRWMVPSIAGVIAICLACVCCSAAGLWFFGDQLLAAVRGPAM